MKIRFLALTLMIFWDFSLHFVELLNWIDYYPLYPMFPNRVVYTLFWCWFWFIALIITINLWRKN